MKVKDLIELLKNENPEDMIVIRGYEGGVSELSSIKRIEIELNANDKWYLGKHEESTNTGVFAVLI